MHPADATPRWPSPAREAALARRGLRLTYARGAPKKLCRPGLSRRETALAALHALYGAADDGSATGGPDPTRRIFPILAVITEEGCDRLTEAETEELSREMAEQRHRRPDGPAATP